MSLPNPVDPKLAFRTAIESLDVMSSISDCVANSLDYGSSIGLNPVDPKLAYRAAVESSLDVVSSIMECTGNGQDYGKTVSINLIGDPIPGKPNTINLTEVIIKDDGIGMDFPTLVEKFRGAFFDSDSHHSTDKSGRNGVGVKTNLQYWNEIFVETTTSEPIPPKERWQCSDKSREEIAQMHSKYSKLKSGDKDTELRMMSLNLVDAKLLPFPKVPWQDSGTTVILKDPRAPIEFNVTEFIRRQSHCIEWLSSPKHKMNMSYRVDGVKDPKKIKVRPFYEKDGKDKFICHIKGNSKEDMCIHYHDIKGTKLSKIVPADTNAVLGDINIDIKILDSESDSTNPNDFVLSVCGASIYDRVRGKHASPSIEYLMGQHNFRSDAGFSRRIHGYVKTKDERLKKALRHNKSVLDGEDNYARAFIEYLVNILKELHKYYIEFLTVQSSQDSIDVIIEIQKEFNDIMRRVENNAYQKKKNKGEGGEKSVVKHKEWSCLTCGKVWRVPLGENPYFCAEFNIVDDKGCGSRDISPNTHAKNDPGIQPTTIEWGNLLGGFIPARYFPDSNKILLAEDHPSFLTTLPAARAKEYQRVVGIEKSFIALATYKAEHDPERSFEEVYGELLREWYVNSSSASHKAFCNKRWKEKGKTIDQV